MITQLERAGQLNRLAAERQESEVIAFALCQPRINQQLEQMPAMKALLEGYQQHGTTKSFLEDNMVRHTSRQVWELDSDLRSFLFSSNVHHQIRTFLQKATFSRWLYMGTNWYGMDQDDIVATIDRSAQFVCSVKPPKEARGIAYSMRSFLSSVVAEEFIEATNSNYDLNEMFASRVGSGIENQDDIDIVGTFGRFAEYWYYPSAFNSFVREYIEGVGSFRSRERLALDKYKDLQYTLDYKKKWISRGLTLLYNILHFKPREKPAWDNIAVDNRKMCRQFRSVFQDVVSVSLIYSGVSESIAGILDH